MTGVLVHEWISQAGGSENVLQAFAELFPDAPVHCLWNDSVDRFDPQRVHESWLASTPLRRSKAAALPFMPGTWRLLDYRNFDWALISSHAFAHHARFRGAPEDFRRLVYVHSPARYVWEPQLDARGAGRSARFVSAGLKRLDRRRAREGAEYAANSAFVAARMRRAWGVEAKVVHPPVEVARIQSVDDWTELVDETAREVLADLPNAFVLGASRFISYKELDRVVDVGEVLDTPVVLAGSGPSYDQLRARAERSRVPVTFVHAPSDALLYALYQRTVLFVFPALEDFGIMPIEAMAAGAPVLARDGGGVRESNLDGVTGSFTDFGHLAAVREAAQTALGTDREARRTHARTFDRARFDREILDWVQGT